MTFTEYIDGIPVHPHAAAYPMMSEGELQDLADDIKANGQHEPIIIANLHPNLMDDPHILTVATATRRASWQGWSRDFTRSLS